MAATFFAPSLLQDLHPTLLFAMDNNNNNVKFSSKTAGKPIQCRGISLSSIVKSCFFYLSQWKHEMDLKFVLNFIFSEFSLFLKIAAAIARLPGEPLVIEEILVDPPCSHEVRIRIICASLCHSDLTVWKMKVFDLNS